MPCSSKKEGIREGTRTAWNLDHSFGIEPLSYKHSLAVMPLSQYILRLQGAYFELECSSTRSEDV